MSSVIDSHAHVWEAGDGFHDWLRQPGLERVNTSFTPIELAARSSLSGVDRVLLVEGGTPRGQDTPMLVNSLRESSRFAGVVAWIDLLSDDLSGEIDHLVGSGVVGFRTQVQAEGDGYLRRPDVRAGIREIGRAGLPFDLVLRPAQWASALELADAQPDSRFVIDHLGNPDFSGGRPSREWIAWMAELGRRANVVVKISALRRDGAIQSPDGVTELVDVAHHCLGATRLLWGSDWPLSLRYQTYAQSFSFAREALAGLSAEERARVFAGTAEEIYGLSA